MKFVLFLVVLWLTPKAGAEAQEIIPHSCQDQVNKLAGCRSYSMLEYFEDPANTLSSRFSKQTQCHFKNQLTVYVYEKDSLYVDTKNLSHLSPEQNGITESFETCDEVMSHIVEISKKSRYEFSPVNSREFLHRDSISLVASERNCEQLSQSLSDLLHVYQQEGRLQSEILCVPQEYIASKDPVRTRQYVRQGFAGNPIIILVGSDIPVFELFEVKKESWGDQKTYGMSDLPYGSSHSFWDSSIPKSDSRLANKVYYEENYIYEIDHPTLYAFDTKVLAQQMIEDEDYRQENAVSRWVERNNIQQEFKRYVEARKNYRPPQDHRFVYAAGGSGVLFRAGEHEEFYRLRTNLDSFLSGLGNHSEASVLTRTQLEGALRNIDRRTTLLVMNEHGSSVAIGDLHSGDIEPTDWFPSILVMQTCYGGAWGFERDLKHSILASVSNTEHPPIAVVGPQGLLWTAFFGEPGKFSDGGWMQTWRQGESLAEHQVRAVHEKFHYLLNDLPYFMKSKRSAMINQALTALSVFGDPSAEL